MTAISKTKVGSRICSEFVSQLRESHFYNTDFLPRFIECLQQCEDRKVQQIVCYGLGSFHQGVNLAPRYQLALLLLMYEKIIEFQDSHVESTIEIFDPQFRERDIMILKSFERPRFSVIKEDELCARELKVTTLVYMPHLHRHLYHNLIGANWHVNNLVNLILVGNSFREMIDSTTVSKAREFLHYINLLVNNFELKRSKPLKTRRGDSVSFDSAYSQQIRALRELSVDTTDDELRFSFCGQAIHYFDRHWLSENGDKMKKSLVTGWTPASDYPDD